MLRSIENYVLPSSCRLGLKVVHSDGRPEHTSAPKGFRWNLEPGGVTEALDWNPKPVCGGGLHLWTWGRQDLGASFIWHRSDVLWLAVEYGESVPLDKCVKVQFARTVAVGSDVIEVADYIRSHTPSGKRSLSLFKTTAVGDNKTVSLSGFGKVAKAGDYGKAIVGDMSIAIAGYKGIAIADRKGRAVVGDGGTSKAGYYGTAIAGDKGTATVTGHGGRAVAGVGGYAFITGYGHAEAGDFGRAEAGMYGTAVAGDNGIAIAEAWGTAIVGKEGKAQVGVGGKAKAGVGGELCFLRVERGSPLTVSIGENGVKPNTFYTLDESGSPIEAEG